MREYNNKRSGNKSYKRAGTGGDNKAVDVYDNSSKYGISEAVQAEPLEVMVNNQFDRALRAFRALVQKERVLSIFKEKAHFEKRSDKRRRKIGESKRNQMELCSKQLCNHEVCKVKTTHKKK